MTDTNAINASAVAACGVAVAAIYATAAAVTRSSAFAENPEILATAVALDLTITATLVAYLLGVRRGHLPWVVLVPVFAAGLIAAHLLVPDDQRGAASVLATAWVAAEMALAGTLLWKLRSVVATYRSSRRDGAAVPDALESGLGAALGDSAVTRMLAAELSLLYFATAGPFCRPPVDRTPERDERVWSAVLLGLGVAMTGEAVAAHLLLASWSMTAAVIATLVHAYATLWLVGDYRALRLSRGLAVDGDALRIDLGLHARATIPLEQIERAVAIDEGDDAEDPPGGIRATVFGRPNLWLHLRAPVTVRLSLGRVRRARVIGIAAGDPGALGL